MKKIKIIQKKKILFISRFYIENGINGGSSYVLDLLKYLKESGFEIIYVLLTQVRFNRNPVYLIPHEVTDLLVVEAERCNRVGSVLVGKFSILEWLLLLIWLAYMQTPLSFKKLYRKGKNKIKDLLGKRDILGPSEEITGNRLGLAHNEIEFIKVLVAKYSPLAMIANFASLAGVFDALADSSHTLKIIQNQDALHQRTGAFTKSGIYLGDLEQGWTYELESAALRKADVIVAIQKEEADLFRTMSPKSTVICAPKAAPIRTAAGEQVPGRCLFVGSGADQNVVGIDWFIREIWLNVLCINPNASLHVCGTVCDSISRNAPNVTFLGRVKDLSREYGEAEVCLVPLVAGSGLKIKLIEALSFGRAVVSTSVGVQGISEPNRKGVYVADTPNDFAKAVVQLFQDPEIRMRMEQQAREAALHEFSAEGCYQPLVDILDAHYQSLIADES